MRQGRVWKRCRKCAAKVTDRRCPRCGADEAAWSFKVDTSAPGEPRKQTERTGFATKSDAIAAMNLLQGEKRDGTHVPPSKQLVADYLATWIAGGAGGVRPWTLKGYSSVVRNHLVPGIGRIPLQLITRGHLRALYAELGKTGQAKGTKAGTALSPKSVHNVHIVIGAALNDAIEDGLLRANPATGALKPPKGRAEMSTWTREELAAFLSTIADPRDYALWRLAAYSGLRRGELLGLRWIDIKWNLSSLSIQQQLGLDSDADGERDLAPLKTDNGRRSISLDAATLEVLRDQQQAQEFERRAWGEAYGNRGLVFCRPDGSPHDPDVITHRFERAAVAGGVRRIRLHDLRHTHATLALEAGIDISVVSRRLGHADVGFTARVYAHVTERLQRDAAAKLSAYLEPMPGAHAAP